MDDKGNMGNQGGSGQPQVQTVTQSQAPVQQPAVTQTQPVSVGISKEAGPVVTADVSEFVKPTEVEPVIEDKEVKEAGIEAVSDKPQITTEHIKAGINVSHQIAPVITAPTGLIDSPMTEEEAKKIIKFHKKISNSIVWMATEILRQFKKLKN